MTMTLRTLMLERVRPLADQLAADLVAIVLARIEADLARLPEAFEVALSAYADDPTPTPELAAMLSPDDAHRGKAPAITERDIKPAKAVKPPAPKGKPGGKMICKKCGFVGGNSRGCGRSHPTRSAVAKTSTSDDESEGEVAGVSQGARPRRIEWDEQCKLIALVQQRGDKRALDMLVRSNMGLVHRLARKCPWHVMPYEDVVQEGAIGLIKGIYRFDLARGFKLSTYASQWIWHYIVRSHEDGAAIRLPARLGMATVKISRAQFKLEEQLGRVPTVEEIAELAKLSVKDVRRVLERGQVTSSLDQVDGDGTSWMHDQIAADQPNAADILTEGDTTTELMAAVGKLEPRAAQAVRHRFIDGMTLKEAGDAMDLSRERVRQIEAVAIKKLRGKLRGEAATP